MELLCDARGWNITLSVLLVVAALSGCNCGGTTMRRNAELTASPSTLDFGTVRVGDVATRKLALTNTGSAPIAVSRVAIEDDEDNVFSIRGDSTQSVPIGGRIELEVDAHPRRIAAAIAGHVRVESDATNAATLVVPLSVTPISELDGGRANDAGHTDAGQDAGAFDGGLQATDAGIADAGPAFDGGVDAGFDAGGGDGGARCTVASSVLIAFDDAGSFGDGAAIADVNGDGLADVVGGFQSRVAVVMQLVDGGFAPAYELDVGGEVRAVEARDIVGSSAVDLIVALRWRPDAGHAVVVFEGTGDGGMRLLSEWGLADAPSGFAVADFNGDGDLDLATTQSNANTIAICDTQPAGVSCGGSANVQMQPLAIAAGDVTGDGRPDLVVTNYGSSTVSVLRRVGGLAGFFAPADSRPVGTQPLSVVVADLNGDGIGEVVVANYVSDDLSIRFGGVDAGFDLLVQAPASLPRALGAGDFDCDGRTDLVVGHWSGSTWLLFGDDGGASFTRRAPIATGESVLSLIVGQLNADSTPDVVMRTSQGLRAALSR